MDQNQTPYAALSQWQIEDIGFHDTIFVAKNSQELFEQMRGGIISDMDALIDHRYEDINCSELETLYEQFVGDDYPADGWIAEDVRELLAELLQKQRLYLKEFPNSPTILGQWYDLVEWMNESCWDVSYDDYLRIPVEGNIVKFVNGLIDFYSPPMPGPKLIDFQEGKWLIKLKHIVSSDRWWAKSEILRKLNRLTDEFNERYQFR